MKPCLRALVLACVIVAPAFAQQASPPVEVFGRLPAVADVAISPDGSKIAIARFEHGEGALLVFDLDRNENVSGMRWGDNEDRLRSVGWADDQHVKFSVSITLRPGQVLPYNFRFRGSPRRVDYWRTGVHDLTTRETQYLTTNEDEPWADQGAPLISPIEGDAGYGRMLGWGSPYNSVHTRRLFRVNLRTGNARGITVRGANADTLQYILDERGQVVARADSDERSNRWRLFAYDGDVPRLLLEDVSDTGEPMPIGGLLQDGRLGVIVRAEGGDRDELRAIDRQTGASEIVFRPEQAGELDGFESDPWTGRIVGVATTGERAEQHFFDPDLQAASAEVSRVFDSEATLVSWSRDRRRFVVYGESGIDGGAYYLYQPEQQSFRSFGALYPELFDARVQITRLSITYPARDGVRIPAYVTLPPGGEHARNLPVVVLVHGGPHARDTFAFDWWASFLASRGYLVLQPNFRGSGGYGRAWEEAGWGQWGGLMQTDVEDGLRALTRNGMADPGRACIVGASYGGYAALAGAALTPDLYVCAASVAGVADLEAMLLTDVRETGAYSPTVDYWRRSIGDREADIERIRAVSPVNLTDRVRIPILLIHGTDDTVVPIQQSRLMQRRLQAAGKDVRLVELTGDDHWLSDEPTRVQMLRELEGFLAQHLSTAAP